MSKNYGVMVGCTTALAWVENLKGVDDCIRERVLSRMRYEFDKDMPVAPKFHKGKYGHRYDYFTCGNCGHILGVTDCFCPDCGFAVAKRTYREA